MRYKNPDPFEKKKAAEIIHEMLELYNEKIADCVKRNFYNKRFSVLSRELQYDVSDGLANAFKQKLSLIHFDDIGVSDDSNSSEHETEYDKFWKNDDDNDDDNDDYDSGDDK